MPEQQIVEPDFKITPSEIAADGHLWGAFDHMETEVSAGYIIRMMQERGKWESFNYDEINRYYREHCKSKHSGNFTFNHLIGSFAVTNGPWDRRIQSLDVIVEREGRYYITVDFVLRAYRSSPAKQEKAS